MSASAGKRRPQAIPADFEHVLKEILRGAGIGYLENLPVLDTDQVKALLEASRQRREVCADNDILDYSSEYWSEFESAIRAFGDPNGRDAINMKIRGENQILRKRASANLRLAKDEYARLAMPM